ncbi:MAG: glycoside hydrolase family 30 protein [Erysipelotrichaceae bacterium]
MSEFEIIRTNQANKQYWKSETAMPFSGYSNTCVRVYPNIKDQTYLGMGGAFTEASGYVFSKLNEEQQDMFINAYFSMQGAGYTIGRSHINSCDFGLGNYACIEEPSLDGFQLEREHKYLLPLLKKANQTAKQPIELMLSPWSPPAFMKTNQEMNHGGTLLPEFAALWASTIARFVEEYRNMGINVSMLSIQNEPEANQTWDSCLYTGKEEGRFIMDHLLPALAAQKIEDLNILVWDHNKDTMMERIEDTYCISGVKEHTQGMAFHWYGGDHFETIAHLHRQHPEKLLIFSEGCVEFSRFAHDAIHNAEMYAHDIIGNFQAGMNGFIDWNILLDAQGGPNHVGNYCAAPIMFDEANKSLDLQLSYYYLGHFSKYLKKGAKRILSSVCKAEIEVTSFENPDGKIVSIVLNRTNSVETFVFVCGEDQFLVELPPHSIATLIEK